jgi:hypothetical protein
MAKGNKILPYLIFGVPLLIGGFFLYKYVKSNKKGQDAPDTPPDPKTTEPSNSDGGGKKPSVTKYFPLKRGSKGGKVKELQQALLGYDSKILPKFGADSDFGGETESAVQVVLGKKTIDSQDDIDSIINKTTKKKSDAETLAKNKVAQDNRSSLATKLIAEFKKNPSNYDWYAVHDTQVTKGEKTSDGRIVNQKNFIYKKGEKIGVSRNASFNNDGGYIEITDGRNYYRFSAYGFEVK